MTEALACLPAAVPSLLLRKEIYEQLNQNTAKEVQLEIGWLHLGRLLTEFKVREAWRGLADPQGHEYTGFDDFMAELRDRWHRGKSQLWAYQSVAEKLLPLIPAETLDEIGITKAMELKRALGMGATLDAVVIEAARSPETTVKELRGIIAQLLSLPDDRMPGTWFDFEGTYLTKEDRLEFDECWEMSVRLLGLKKDQSTVYHRREIFMAWVREFYGTHCADVYGPETAAAPEFEDELSGMMPADIPELSDDPTF